jgi:hypothetical protein
MIARELSAQERSALVVLELRKTGTRSRTMKIQARNGCHDEHFSRAREKFEEIVTRVEGRGAETLTATEEYLATEGDELLRLLVQARLDILFERECAGLGKTGVPNRRSRRRSKRGSEGLFGRVVVRRHAIVEPGRPWRFPMDEELNLSDDMYSHGVRRRIAEEVTHGSFDHAVDQISRTTGAHVPKKQAQQLTVRAARDVEAFHAERVIPANDTLSENGLLVMSSDGAAVRMVQAGLREPTRRAAEKADQQEAYPRGDPTAAAAVKPHQTRRAMVTAVWEQERHDRTAADIVANLCRDAKDRETRKKARGPRPQRKRLTASIEQDLGARVSEMFDEADRRDPGKVGTTVCVVDGDEAQTNAIKMEAAGRGRSITIVLDLLHAMHYVWLAAQLLAPGSGKEKQLATQELVVRWTTMLLTSRPAYAIAAIRSAATRAGLRGKARKTVDSAADYLLKRTPFMRYHDFIALGLPIASGVIEGACRHVVRDRLDITGARWGLEDAEAVLKLRAIHASGDWDEYWVFHEAQEARRRAARAA